jgi:CRP-like cAMP-binding protein
MSVAIDKDILKEALRELIHEEPDFVEILIQDIQLQLKTARRTRLEQIINEDFDEYDEVFKALA